MSDGRSNKKKRFRSDGTSIWSKRSIDGPGVWVTCVKGKEKQTIGEVYELFETLAEEFWPSEKGDQEDGKDSDEDDDGADGEVDIEELVAKEVQKMKRPRKEQRFANCPTDTPCVFISCKPPVDPVKLVEFHLGNIERTGVTRTRNVQRMIPIVKTCNATLPDIVSLSKKVVARAFENEEGKSFRYKIELRIRNHSTVSKDETIKAIAQSVTEGHKVDLADPELVILVEIFKGICGISVVRDYYRYKKFNVVELSQAKMSEDVSMKDEAD